MKPISNRKWTLQCEETAQEIKEWLIKNGGEEDKNINNQYEKWRIKYLDTTITFYKSSKKMTIYITDSDYSEILEVHKFIDSKVSSKFLPPNRKYLIGLDEVGKGEVIGHEILVGVLFPHSIFTELEQVSGVANTKIKRNLEYWEGVFNKLDYYKSKGLMFLYEKIPPWDIDKYNINNLMDITYQRILNTFAQKVALHECRIVVDDYGIGVRLKKFLEALKNSGAEVIVTHNADEKYLESRLASLIGKYIQQKVLEAISKNSEYQLEGETLGSGNAGDLRTLSYLKKWWEKHKKWPWFVKQSFKTIAEIEGRKTLKKIRVPPLNEDIISEEFREKFYNGKLEITSLHVICPKCGEIIHSIKLIFKDELTTAICINCFNELKRINDTLKYFCGRILPDSSVIRNGFLSKDLEKKKFFENFTILIHPIVKKETDTRGGKKEWENLGHFHSMGRIRLEEIIKTPSIYPEESTERDNLIQQSAVENNAILITGDNQMKGLAQAKNLFVIEI